MWTDACKTCTHHRCIHGIANQIKIDFISQKKKKKKTEQNECNANDVVRAADKSMAFMGPVHKPINEKQQCVCVCVW